MLTRIVLLRHAQVTLAELAQARAQARAAGHVSMLLSACQMCCCCVGNAGVAIVPACR